MVLERDSITFHHLYPFVIKPGFIIMTIVKFIFIRKECLEKIKRLSLGIDIVK